MRYLSVVVAIILAASSATAWTPPAGTPLAIGVHPRLVIISDAYRASNPTAVGFTVNEMRTKISANYSAEFQAFITTMDGLYSTAANTKGKLYSTFDGMDYAFLYLMDPQNMAGFTAAHTAAEYGAKAKEHALFVASQAAAETVFDTGEWVDHRLDYELSEASGGSVNMSMALIYDWCNPLFSQSERQQLLDGAYKTYTLRVADFSGQLINNKHTAIAMNGDYVALAMYGDDVGSAPYSTYLAEMFDSIDTDWNQRIFGFTDLIYENGANWTEGSLYNFESFIHMSWMAHGMRTALNYDYFKEMPYFRDHAKFLLYNTMPWRVNGKIAFGHFDDDAPEDGYFSVSSLNEVLYTIIGNGPQDDSKALKWLQNESGFIDNGVIGTSSLYQRRQYLFSHFLSGNKTVTSSSPASLNLPKSINTGGQYIFRTGFDSADDTVISFWGQKYQVLHGGHSHNDFASFTISKYGDLAIQRSIAKNFSGGNIAQTKQNMFYNTMGVYKPGELDSIFTRNLMGYRNNFSTTAGYPTSPEFQENGLNHVGTVVEEDLEGIHYDYVDYNYTNAWPSTKVDYAEREFVYLRSNGGVDDEYVVVFDRINATDASYKKYFLLHGVEEPEVRNSSGDIITLTPEKYPAAATDDGGRWIYNGASTGDTITLKNNLYSSHGKVVNRTIFPASFNINKIGGVGHYWEDADGGLIHTSTFVDRYKYYRGTYSVQIESTTNQQYDTFLNVMQIGDVTMTPSAMHGIDTNNAIGVHIADGVERVAIFPKNKNSKINGDINYTISTSSTARHLIVGLEPSTIYAVTISGVVLNVTNVTNSAGVLEFVDTSSGSRSIVISEGSTAPPILPASFRIPGGAPYGIVQ